jgi:hypothetical protein
VFVIDSSFFLGMWHVCFVRVLYPVILSSEFTRSYSKILRVFEYKEWCGESV